MALFAIALCFCGFASAPALLWGQSPARAPSVKNRVQVRNPQARDHFLPRVASTVAEPLAVDGYCVVTLRDESRWVRGSDEREAVFDGMRYRFADAERVRLFLSDPDAYAPVLNGDCPVEYAASGRRQPGRSQWGLVHERRLYFFASAENRRSFSSAAPRYVEADLVAGGQCLVSQADERRNVAGNPLAYARYDGLRYWFANGHHRDRFLADPMRYAPTSVARGGRDATISNQRVASARGAGASDPSAARGDASAPADQEARGGQAPGAAARGAPAADEGVPQPSVSASSVAMASYCPVTIRDQGSWVRGRLDQTAAIDQWTFALAGLEEKEAFLAHPARYIPALGGACPVTYVKTGRRVAGSIYHAASLPETGILYLFASAAEKSQFRSHPDRYARIDVAANGVCVVTLRETQAEKPGDPAFSAWYEGWRYFFADEAQRAKFLADRQRYAVEPPAAPTPEPSP